MNGRQCTRYLTQPHNAKRSFSHGIITFWLSPPTTPVSSLYALFRSSHPLSPLLKKGNDTSYKLRINQFGDLTLEEFTKRLYDPKIRNITSLSHLSRLSTYEKTKRKEAPPSIDWTNHNGQSYVTPVKNMGSCNGGSYAFAAVGVAECNYAIEAGPLNSLSEQQIIDCSGRYGNGETSSPFLCFFWGLPLFFLNRWMSNGLDALCIRLYDT